MQGPPKRSKKLVVVLPSSILGVEPGLREKTVKAGMIARAAAVFRVDEILVYRHGRHAGKNALLLVELLRYAETPPHLRRRLVPLKPELRYVGLIPPLQIPSHPESPVLRVGEYREGVVVEDRGRMLVDVGAGALVELEPAASMRPPRRGDRVTVRIVSLDPPRALQVRRPDNLYWGYRVRASKSLAEALRLLGSRCYILATSRRGRSLKDAWDELRKAAESPDIRGFAVLFGGPGAGLYEIAEEEGLDIDENTDVAVNFVPNQGTRTVRTEEALFIALGILNILLE